VAASTKRKNQRLLELLRAVALAGATYAGLAGMGFAPAWGAIAFAVAVGVLGYIAVDLGVLVALIALAIPMTAANPVVGIAFVVLGIIGIRYLGADGGRVFMIVALAVGGAFFGPVWAAAAIAGLVMGVGEGALAAAIACLTVEALGVALGRAAIGATVTGGAKALLVFGDRAPETLFSAAWLSKSFAGIGTASVEGVVGAFASTQHPSALVVQPLVWAGAAAITAILVRESRKRRSAWLTTGAVGVGALMPAAASLLVARVAGTTVSWGIVASSAASSAVVAAVFAFVWERVFPLERVAGPQTAPRSDSMAAQDADVDELLRLISTAEETLASKHTTQRVVMITDMKSFSKMTEEDGSILTAKAIQKHRDLLLPLVEQHGGHGKSTGGDGLVAAFDSPSEAVCAAAEMQRALDNHNSSHAGERDMTVRIGIADGEVVLDKGGRPFIGAALNLAARVMNLADGGQAFTTAAIAAKAGGTVSTHSHGTFELKNIATPVEVVEILWGKGQLPRDPRSDATDHRI